MPNVLQIVPIDVNIINFFTFSGASDERLACRINPPVEDTLHEGAFCSGTAKISCASGNDLESIYTAYRFHGHQRQSTFNCVSGTAAIHGHLTK